MEKFIMFFAVLYGISVAVFTLYFNWIYANEHGFWSWLIFGEIIATFKGFAWPFFVNW
jgi:hypothetical protein